MNLEIVFCEIKTNRRNIAHGWLPLLVIFDDHHLGTSMPSGAIAIIGGLLIDALRVPINETITKEGHKWSTRLQHRKS